MLKYLMLLAAALALANGRTECAVDGISNSSVTTVRLHRYISCDAGYVEVGVIYCKRGQTFTNKTTTCAPKNETCSVEGKSGVKNQLVKYIALQSSVLDEHCIDGYAVVEATCAEENVFEDGQGKVVTTVCESMYGILSSPWS